MKELQATIQRFVDEIRAEPEIAALPDDPSRFKASALRLIEVATARQHEIPGLAEFLPRLRQGLEEGIALVDNPSTLARLNAGEELILRNITEAQ